MQNDLVPDEAMRFPIGVNVVVCLDIKTVLLSEVLEMQRIAGSPRNSYSSIAFCQSFYEVKFYLWQNVAERSKTDHQHKQGQ